ncbi:hypothetical protein JVU11DRAFT_7774 [Chiua virens]|nr:hypothetical protein JVU11DRAFT_7774 [Chiua virens]
MSAPLQTIRAGDLLASTAFFYDFILTLPDEVYHFWERPKLNWGSALFFSNRYFAFCLHILITAQVLTEQRPDGDLYTCDPIQIAKQGGIMSVQLLCAGIMMMRVYALYEKGRVVLVFLWILTAAVLGFSLWAFFFDPSGAYNLQNGISMSCIRSIDPTVSIHLAIAWGGQLFFDVVIFVLTLWRSFYIRTESNRSLVDVLLRDGALYFAILSAANIANIAMVILANADYKAIGGVILNSLTSVMASRLMINIREMTPRGTTTRRSTVPTMTTIIPMHELTEV